METEQLGKFQAVCSELAPYPERNQVEHISPPFQALSSVSQTRLQYFCFRVALAGTPNALFPRSPLVS
eukprot:3423478-Amphidinium_carterae.1